MSLPDMTLPASVLAMTSATATQGGVSRPSSAPAPYNVRKVSFEDMKEALLRGFEDWRICRTDVLVMAVLYPIAAIFVAAVVVDQALLPFVFPVLAGFALVGPMATMWFAALSRQREIEGVTSSEAAARIFEYPKLKAIQRLCLIVIGLFLAWIVVAGVVYGMTLGQLPASQASFFSTMFTTRAGWTMIMAGCLSGAAFAVITLAIGLVSFPMTLDRDVTVTQAIGASVRAALRNPGVALGWGGVIVAGLILGALPGLLGLTVVLPILGHANWHLYRRIIH
ncbi:MAG TPA: DUF2189 domain-containing protein [Acidocella sp.]|nr:DUF2189 domain-containing protein [Acidocella sp.]